MKIYIQAELLKLKRTFTAKLIWLAPLMTLLLCFGLMAGPLFQIASFNWWYTLILPGTLSLMAIGTVQKERKKLNYRAILGLPVPLGKVWLGKIGAVTVLLTVSSLLLLAGITLSGGVFPALLSVKHSLVAGFLLVVTFLWQIPLCMYLFMRLGMYGALLLNLMGNIIAVVAIAASKLWWIFPYAIPMRLMCPVLGIHPNGVPLPAEHPLLEPWVILPGVLIALGWFVLLSMLTLRAFKRQEAR